MLSSDGRRAVRDLAKAALKYEPQMRADFVREASHGDARLSDEALRILEEVEARRIESGTPAQSDSELLDQVIADSADTQSAAIDDTTSPATLREFHGTVRFDLRRKLGAGGFGTVYECYDREQQQSVALKVLRRPDPAFVYRFKREFRALVDIRHPNLIELYELFHDRQFWFFTMELVRGITFLEHVRRRDRSRTPGGAACNVERLRAALLQLADGILALHLARILHRDIKPGNVLVSPDGRVRLLDFGLVRELESSHLHSGMLAGTPAYMAPEEFAGVPSDTPADWYSFGVMLFQALTGTTPQRRSPEGDDALVLSRLVDVPEDLRRLCIALLHVDPKARPTGPEVRERLGATTPPVAGAPLADADEHLIGRERSLAELARLLRLTKQGRAVVVNLCGQSGIGKSTLIRAFRRRLAKTDPDVVVLNGRCHENETVPFKALDALVDDLSQHLKELSAAEAEALTPRDAPSLMRMFPALAQVDAIAQVRRKSPDIVDAQELRRRAFASLQDLFVRLAERRTVVVAIDDVQWGDLDSAAFLHALFSGSAPPSLMLIASYRVEDVETSPFLQAWRSQVGLGEAVTLEQLELQQLTENESQQLAHRLLQSATGQTAPMESAPAIVRESGGSPFLIEQFVRYTPPSGANTVGLSIGQTLEHRLRELPPRSRRLLEMVAVAGQPLAEAVAFTAAGSESADRPALFTLVSAHLLRVRETNGPRQIEVYHDRFREMIVAAMSTELRQHCHRQLARAWETQGPVDAAALSMHYRAAGDIHRGAVYAVSAGEQASGALAFERAAQWYRLALEGTWSTEESIAIRRSLADTLSLAGRGPEAADAYVAAADIAAPMMRSDLRRLAAEQLLRAGHVDNGLAVLEGVARELGIWLPATRLQTVLSLVFHRVFGAPLVLARSRPGRRPSPAALMTLDVYWSFFIGLTNFDPIRAMDFHARHRVLASRVGDPTRLALSLAMEAASRAASGGASPKRIAELIARARAETHSPEVLGLIATSEALCACASGQWRRGLDLANEADRFLSEQCSTMAWERATNIQLRFTAVFYLGEWRLVSDYTQRLPNQIEEARARGDVHAMVTSIPGATMLFLMADQPLPAERFIRDTIALLPDQRFLMPNVWVLGLQAYIALYTGAGDRAWAVVNELWPALLRSQFLRVEYIATFSFDVRARAALAVAVATDRPEPHLREALRCARRLARKRSLWAQATAALIRACVASVRHQSASTLQLLEEAEGKFRLAEMSQYVAVCEYRRGMLTGGESGEPLVAAAHAWATAQGVVNPARIFDMLTPGHWNRR